jgi:hypothetical protein
MTTQAGILTIQVTPAGPGRVRASFTAEAGGHVVEVAGTPEQVGQCAAAAVRDLFPSPADIAVPAPRTAAGGLVY